MASYNELNALIDAYINRNGVQAITGRILNGVLKAMVEQLGRGYTIMGAATPTTDPGTPDGPECYFASATGTYTDFDGLQVVPGELALLCYTPTDGWTKATIYEGFREVGATIDGNVGTPSVGVSYADGVLSFDFHNMKGNPGQNGQDGAEAGFGTIGADITGGVGTPAVTVESSGPATAKNLQFHFTNLKGETGVTSVVATVDNTTGTPACTVSLVGQQLTLAFTGLKGAQGDTGSSVDYPFTIVNNLTTDDATQALSAAQGVVLEGEITQLEAKVTDLIAEGKIEPPLVNDKYIDVTTGEEIAYNGWKCTGFVNVENVSKIEITQGAATTYNCWYDINKTRISDFALSSGVNVIDVPANAIFFRVSNTNSGIASGVYKVLAYKGGKIDEKIGAVVIPVTESRKFINLSGGVGTTVPSSPTSSNSWSYHKRNVSEGDIIRVNGVGGNNSRLWAFVNSSDVILSVADAGTSSYEGTITLIAPPNSAYVIINDNSGQTSYYEEKNSFNERLKKVEDTVVLKEKENIFNALSFIAAYVDETTGQVVPYNTYRTSEPFPVKKGDKVEVRCVGTGVFIISTTTNETISVGDYVSGKVATTSTSEIRDYEYIAESDEYVVICGTKASVNEIFITHYSDIDDTVLDLGKRVENLEQNNNVIDTDTLLLQKKIGELGSYYFRSSNDAPVSYDEDEYLNTRINAIPEGKHFIFVTDTHISSSARKSTYLIDYVRKRLGINKVVFGGDSIDGYDTKYEAARYVREYANEFFGAFGKNSIWVQGNHDANAPRVISTGIDPTVGLIDNDVIYNATIKHIEDVVVFDSDGIAKLGDVFTDSEIPAMTYWMKMHYYIDDEKDKIRYIVLETGDNSPAAMLFGNIPLWLQLDFLANSLATVPEGYSCVVLAHMVGWQSMSNDSTKYRPWFQQNDISAHLIEILSAYRNKTTVTIDCEDHYPFRNEAQLRAKAFFSLNGTSHTYDFTNVVGDGIVFLNSGHWHFDMAFVYMANGQWQSTGDETVCKVEEIGPNDDLSLTTGAILLWTNRDAYGLPSAYKTKDSDEVKRIIMTNNTITEHSFDVITISNGTLYCTRFGAGEDRNYRL